jgi:predicted SprT family Zn-dependent metalloprotease
MTREQWLQLFIERARPHFERVGSPLPERIRASIGFTSKGERSRAIGECWSADCAQDDTFEIFIAPKEKDAARIADILTHELVHTAMEEGEGHGKEFRRVATSLGLCGQMTATEAGPGWFEWAQDILDAIGPYPGTVLEHRFILKGGKKKQTTRQIKCECLDCGFIFRASNVWLEGKEIRCPNATCDGEIKHG